MTSKWRPRLSVIVVVILMAVLALPLFGLFFFRLYENQLVRQTESELIAQSAAIAAAYRAAILGAGVPAESLGAEVPADVRQALLEPIAPIEPNLDLASDRILPQRPEPRPGQLLDPAYLALSGPMEALLEQTQRTTLAGFRLLDMHGVVVAGGENGQSLAHVEEVATAMRGRYASVMRLRVSNREPPPVYSVSRGTGVRVFVAMPVVVGTKVAGVVYVSRTPNNIVKHLYGERGKLMLAIAAVVTTTLLIGLVFVRTISRPMHELIDRTRRIALGDREAIQPLSHHGTREMALLGDAFLDMARKLQARSDSLQSFATHVSHELKSPLTSIQGAAELLRDAGGEMNTEERQKFSQNIVADAGRLNNLVGHLLDLARAETVSTGEASSTLEEALALTKLPPHLAVAITGKDLRCRISAQNLAIVVSNFADNSARHGATTLDIHALETRDGLSIVFADDGTGIAPGDRERVFAPFFTTRREHGGTGIGLSIVAALVKAQGGAIRLLNPDRGAAFEVTLSAA